MQFDRKKKQTFCGKTLSVGHSSGSVNNLLYIVTGAVLQNSSSCLKAFSKCKLNSNKDFAAAVLHLTLVQLLSVQSVLTFENWCKT